MTLKEYIELIGRDELCKPHKNVLNICTAKKKMYQKKNAGKWYMKKMYQKKTVPRTYVRGPCTGKIEKILPGKIVLGRIVQEKLYGISSTGTYWVNL